MSKRIKLLFTCVVVMFIWGLSFSLVAKADEPVDLIVAGGKPEYVVPGIAPGDGVIKGWGCLADLDSCGRVVRDPEDPNNTVMRLQYTTKAFSSFFKFAPIEQGTKYQLTVDFKIDGTTDNLGVAFAGPNGRDEHYIVKTWVADGKVEQDTWPEIEGKVGWRRATFTHTTTTDKPYDSIQMWMYTFNDPANKVYVDNFKLFELDENDDPVGENLITGFDFEGFLEFGVDPRVYNGDFEGWVVEEHLDTYDFEPVAPGKGAAAGWGSGTWDSFATAMPDPEDEDNTVIKLYYNREGKPFASFFKFVPFESGSNYEVTLDYKIVGQTNNFGFGFAGLNPGRDDAAINQAEAVDVPGKDGWKRATTTRMAAADRDSIQLWFNTHFGEGDNLTTDNYVLLDNITIYKLDAEGNRVGQNLCTGGTFEGFLHISEVHALGTTPEIKGVAGGYYVTSDVSVPYAEIIDETTALKFEYTTDAIAAFRKLVTLSSTGRYTLKFDVKLGEDFEAKTFGFRFLNKDDDTHSSRTLIISNGEQKGTWTPVADKEGWYTVEILVDAFAEEFNAIEMYLDTEENPDNYLYIDNLSVKPKSTKTNLFDNKLTNGHFDSFKIGLELTKTPLLGNWSSPEGGNGAIIKWIDNNRAVSLGYGEEDYTYLNVTLPKNLKAGSLVRLSYDFKYNYTSSEYPVMKSYFIGAAGKEHYAIDLYEIFDHAFTSGDRNDYYEVRVEENTLRGAGWQRVTLEFLVDPLFVAETDSIRWAFTAFAEEDELYIDNVVFQVLSSPTECPTCEICPEPEECPDPEVCPEPEECPTCEECPVVTDGNNGWIWAVVSAGIVAVGAGGVFFFMRKKS